MADDGFTINGKSYTADDLTFREQRELRAVVREMNNDPTLDMDDMPLMDLLPALVYIVVRRDRPDFTIDDALDLKPSDLVASDDDEPVANGNGNGSARKAATRATRPTKTPVGSGIPS